MFDLTGIYEATAAAEEAVEKLKKSNLAGLVDAAEAIHQALDKIDQAITKVDNARFEQESKDNGLIVLKIRSGGHAADLMAAAQIQEWLDAHGLQQAAELLPLSRRPIDVGPGQMTLSYPQAA